MEFGIWSNGFRRRTSPAQTYQTDLEEIILADELGFRDAYISEHHAEPIYIDKVDTLPVPELLMCKAAALTKNIRFGAAIKIAHLLHPVDVAMQAAATDNVIGGGRFIFGFGSGFPSPVFAEERGMTHEDRHARLMESLELIRKIWSEKHPFDWNGKFWQGKSIVPEPHPFNGKDIPMATATDQPEMIKLAGENGWTLLSAFLEPPHVLRAKADKYCEAADAVGRKNPRENISVSRLIYIAGSKEEAMDDMREEITFELGFQINRGLVNWARNVYKLPIEGDSLTIEDMVRHKLYTVGTPEQVTEELVDAWEKSGGFGTLLMLTGKGWSTKEKRARSLRDFMEKVAPKLKGLGAVA
ncbi:MAG: LLM class flavin-dependent oxidoreductase [Beijerinckiaceae bacterium]